MKQALALQIGACFSFRNGAVIRVFLSFEKQKDCWCLNLNIVESFDGLLFQVEILYTQRI